MHIQSAIVTSIVCLTVTMSVAADQVERTPHDIVGIAMDDGTVYSWYTDGTYSKGTIYDLDAYATREPFDLPAQHTPADIQGLFFSDIPPVFIDDSPSTVLLTIYHSGELSAGTPSDLEKHSRRHRNAFREQGPGERVGLTSHFTMWYADATSISGHGHLPYATADGRDPRSIVGLASGSVGGLDCIITYYDDQTVSIGTRRNLKAYEPAKPYTIDEIDLREGEVILPGNKDATRIRYEVRGERAYLGDIDLGPVDQLGHLRQAARHQRLGTTNSRQMRHLGPDTEGLYAAAPHRWWGGIIPYQINATGFEEEHIDRIHRCMEELTRRTHLTIVPRLNEKDYVTFVRGNDRRVGGMSPVGRRGGEQFITIVSPTDRVIIHEMLHTVGMWHEHCRPDRDEFVEVHLDNIVKQFRYNFDVVPDTSQPSVPYDPKSIMHYPGVAFGLKDEEGRRRITILDLETGFPAEGGTALSELDIRRTNLMYPLTLARKANLFVTAPGNPEVNVWAWSQSHKTFVPGSYPFRLPIHQAGYVLHAADVFGKRGDELLVLSPDTKRLVVMTHGVNSCPTQTLSWVLPHQIKPQQFGCGHLLGRENEELLALDGTTLCIWASQGRDLVPAYQPTELEVSSVLAMAVGNPLGEGLDQLLVLHPKGLTTVTVRSTGVYHYPLSGMDHATPSLVLLGNMLGDEKDEIILFDTASGEARIWQWSGHRLEQIALTKLDNSPGDALVVADVTGNDYAEIIHADGQTGQIRFIGLNQRRTATVCPPLKTPFRAGGSIMAGMPTYRP